MTQIETKKPLRRFFDGFIDIFFGVSMDLGFGGGEKLAPKHPFPSGIPSGKGDSSGSSGTKK